jgi:hypothetical protein
MVIGRLGELPVARVGGLTGRAVGGGNVEMSPRAVRHQDLRRELLGMPAEREPKEVIDEAVVPAT